MGANPASDTVPGCALLTTTTLSACLNLTPSTATVPVAGVTANCTPPPLPDVWYRVSCSTPPELLPPPSYPNFAANWWIVGIAAAVGMWPVNGAKFIVVYWIWNRGRHCRFTNSVTSAGSQGHTRNIKKLHSSCGAGGVLSTNHNKVNQRVRPLIGRSLNPRHSASPQSFLTLYFYRPAVSHHRSWNEHWEAVTREDAKEWKYNGMITCLVSRKWVFIAF